MKMTRPIARVGDCIAVVLSKGQGKGKPLLGSRPSARFNGQRWSAYRLSYHLNVEEITRTPPSLKDGLVLHTCDNEWCVNPEHLYLGTQRQNVIDMIERSPGVREKMSISQTGRKHPESVKRKISHSNKGLERSESHSRSISAGRKKFFDENHERRGENAFKAREFWRNNPEAMKKHMEKMRAARGKSE